MQDAIRLPDWLTAQEAQEIGLWEYGLLPTEKILFSEEVRALCRDNVCGRYGTSWACPPAVGTVEECRARCLAYPNILVFSAKYDLEDSFDFEGMQAGMRAFKTVCTRLDETAQKHLSRFMLLSNESCGRCEKCTYPDAPCRFPDQLYPAIEGHGILVNLLAARAGIRYINGPDTVTYFGGLFF